MLAEFSALHLLPLAGILLILTSLMMWRRKRQLRGDPCLTPQEELERNKQLRGMRGDLEELMVEIEQLAKRLSTHLDAKTIELDMAVHRADEKIKALRQLTEQGGGAPVNRNSSNVAAAGATSPTPAPPAAATSSPQTDQHPVDPLARSVHQLADKGLAAAAIAQQLNEHIGKIELILALRQPSRANL